MDGGRLRKLRSLLLTYLFAVKAAADCPGRPTVQHETDLSEESMLVDQYSEGVQLHLVCVSGYFRENGTGITTCKNGEWTKPDLICRKKNCGPPHDQPHMKFNMSAGTLFGATIRVLCDKGYSLSGSAYKQCLNFGWFGRAKCKPVVCKMPPQVANSTMSWDGENKPSYGEIIHYSCEEGYTLIGNSNITCDENGGYTPEPPECKKTTFSVSSTTSTFHGNKFSTTQAASTVSREADSGSSKAFEETVTSSTSSFLEVTEINASKESVSVPVTISLTAVFLVTIIVMVFLYILHKRKKGLLTSRGESRYTLYQTDEERGMSTGNPLLDSMFQAQKESDMTNPDGN